MISTKSKKRMSGGFTLVELLFVIAIIAVLSTMSLGIMRSAQEDAKESATLARIRAIEAILQIELEDYEVRRLPISTRVLVRYVNANSLHGGRNVGAQVRNLRRRIIADMIISEFPRPALNASNVFEFNPDVGQFPTNSRPLGGTMGFKDWLDANYSVPSTAPLSKALNDVRSAKVRSWQAIYDLPAAEQAKFDLPGEYLYAALQRIDFDGAPATEQLGVRAIGDSDNDGFPEIVDSWGEPMRLRIWQVDAQAVGTDVWEDVPNVDFDVVDPVTSIPTGYAVINPTVPREVSKIRFQVTSTRLAL